MLEVELKSNARIYKLVKIEDPMELLRIRIKTNGILISDSEIMVDWSHDVGDVKSILVIDEIPKWTFKEKSYDPSFLCPGIMLDMKTKELYTEYTKRFLSPDTLSDFREIMRGKVWAGLKGYKETYPNVMMNMAYKITIEDEQPYD